MAFRLMSALLLAAVLAGCGAQQTSDLGNIYTQTTTDEDFEFPGVPMGNHTLIEGTHLEGRLNDGAWGGNLSATIDGGIVESPAMAGPEPSGGGGETTVLPTPANTTLEVRIVEHAQLAGYDAHWYFTLGDSGDEAEAVVLPADQVFERRITAGTFHVTAMLAPSGEAPTALFAEGVTGMVEIKWTANGEVQPVLVPSQGAPLPPTAERDQQVDKYKVELPAGVTLKADSAFNGAFGPGDGTDVDLGVWDPAGAGVMCAGSGGSGPGSPLFPDPSQSTETVAYETDSTGAWSVEVGDQNGCQDNLGYSYTNAGPVPYTVTIVAS